MKPKKLWIGADWKAERDHYGLDNRCGMFSVNRLHEDDKGYLPADLVRELVEAVTEYFDARNLDESVKAKKRLESALAALKAMEG